LRVEGERAKQRILSVLADPYSRKILDAIMQDNKSALELSRECGIPVTTVYRRVEELLHDGLIAAVRYTRNKDGKWFELYRSLLKNINITAEKGMLIVEVGTDDNVPHRLVRGAAVAANPSA